MGNCRGDVRSEERSEILACGSNEIRLSPSEINSLRCQRNCCLRQQRGSSAALWDAQILSLPLLYMLKGIEVTAAETIELVQKIACLMKEYKRILKERASKMYSHDLLNCLFYSPYTKIEHLESHLGISRPTAAKYLDEMVRLELLKKEKIWRRNYYINAGLVAILAHTDVEEIDSAELVRTAEK